MQYHHDIFTYAETEPRIVWEENSHFLSIRLPFLLLLHISFVPSLHSSCLMHGLTLLPFQLCSTGYVLGFYIPTQFLII